MNTLVLAPFSEEGLSALAKLGSVTYEPWTQTQRLYDPAELGVRLRGEGFGALVVEADFLFAELFEAATGLRFAAICRAALNQVDLEAATEHGVLIVHTPGRNAQAVAELVLGLMLSLARRLPEAAAYLAKGQWEDPIDPYVRFRGRELAGATLGVVGLGEIGRCVAKLGHGVGMSVLAHDPYVYTGLKRTGRVKLVGLDDLMERSDFVTIHVPETDQTKGMIAQKEIDRLGSTSYLVNVTSPAVVDETALVEALNSGAIAGAAMDVHDAHPIPPNSRLIGLPRVLLTPHIGGATIESIERHSAMVVTDLQAFIQGRPIKRLVTPGARGKRQH